MSEDKKLGEIIRQKLSEGDFTFDESNWEKAKSMIDAEDKRKKRIAFFILFGIIGSIAAVFLFTYSGGTKKQDAVVLTVKENPESKMNSSENSIVDHSENSEVKKDNGTSKINKSSKQKTIVKQSVKTENTAQKKITNAVVKNKNVTVKTNSLSNTIKKTETVKEKELIVTKNKTQKKTADVVVKNKKTVEKTDLASNNNKIKTTKEKEIKTTADINKAAADSVLSTQNKNIASNKKEESSSVKNISENNNEALAKLLADSTKYSDSLVAQKQKEQPDKIIPGVPKNVFAFEAGANYMFGWMSANGKDANGINLVFGVNYLRFLNNKLAVNAGIQFNNIGNLSLSKYTALTTQYDFGLTSNQTTITPKMLYYLVAPVKINYFINSKNSIGLGCNVAYLLNTSSLVETSGNSPFVNTQTASSVKRGYVNGFTTFDFQMAVLYRRQLYKNLGINTELFYGLTDIKNNIFYNSAAFERNAGVKLTFTYNFLKK